MNKIGGSKIDYECFSPELEASCNEIQHLFKERILAKIEKRKAQKLGLLPLGALPAIVFFFQILFVLTFLDSPNMLCIWFGLSIVHIESIFFADFDLASYVASQAVAAKNANFTLS